MNEMTRTLSYVGVAVLLALGAIWVTPKPAETTEGDLVGTVLLPDLKDATSVEGLEVVSVDGTTKQIEKFKVLKGRLPSHEDYPADAEKQLVNAVSGLINLKVQDVVTKNSAQHAEYGVIEPKEDKVTPGAVGVGKLVNILGKSGRSVGKLVIGNEDKLTGGGASLRFVRLLPSDNVYRVALAGDNFTTKFENWIDTDLLKLETPDIAEVTLDDYSMAREAGGWTYDPRSKIILDFDDKTAKWDLKELLRYTNGNPEKVEVGPDQELNTLTLNDLKTALDELKIVDVRRKPKGISGTLTAKTMDFSGVSSLAEHGFYPLKTDAVSDEIEIMSSNGQISVQMKDGVQYLLRFGGVAGLGKEDEKPDAAKTGEEGATPATKLNRYIMVSAQFNKDVIPPPQLQPVPELPDNDSTSSEAPPSDAAAKSADGKAAEGKAGDAKSNDTKSKSGEESVGSDAKKLTADEREELVLRRKKVLAENAEQQKQYDAKIKQGEESAKDLNDRFAEWYYVVSEDTYKKIHLSESEVIKQKGVSPGNFGPGFQFPGGFNPQRILNDREPEGALPIRDPFQQSGAPIDSGEEGDGKSKSGGESGDGAQKSSTPAAPPEPIASDPFAAQPDSAGEPKAAAKTEAKGAPKTDPAKKSAPAKK